MAEIKRGYAKLVKILAETKLKQGPSSQALRRAWEGILLLAVRYSKLNPTIFSAKLPKITQIAIVWGSALIFIRFLIFCVLSIVFMSDSSANNENCVGRSVRVNWYSRTSESMLVINSWMRD